MSITGLTLTLTHDIGGISDYDIKLAGIINKLHEERQ
jgi:pterin-4a-carbinolamine dehydratase